MDLGKVKKLIKLIEKADISEIAIEEDGVKIEIKKESAITSVPHAHVGAATPPPVQHHVQPMHAPAEEAPAKAAAKDENAGLVAIKAPMVGTFYRAPSPDAEPFVEVGSRIEKGAPVCIVEAMKMFNEIESDVSGTVKKLVVNNADPVEFGQALLLIDPS